MKKHLFSICSLLSVTLALSFSTISHAEDTKFNVDALKEAPLKHSKSVNEFEKKYKQF